MANIENKKDFIRNVVWEMGISRNLLGFDYIVEAVNYFIETQKSTKISITKDLYPNIAEKFETSASSVERCIRNAFQISCDKNKLVNLNQIFNVNVFSENERPYSSEILCFMADQIARKFRKAE